MAAASTAGKAPVFLYVASPDLCSKSSIAQKWHMHTTMHPASCLCMEGAQTGRDLTAAHKLFVAAGTCTVCRRGVRFRAMPQGLGAGRGTGTPSAP